MTYKDRTFCANAKSCADRHICGRYYSDKDKVRNNQNIPVSYAAFYECYTPDKKRLDK